MKPAPFEQTPEFKDFTAAMQKLVAVPKSELDEQVRLHEKRSKGNRNKRRGRPSDRSAKSS